MSDYAIQYAKSLGVGEEALHRRMMADPEDSTGPLVYADWLEDHERPAAADFIRAHYAEDNDSPRFGRYLNEGYADPREHSIVMMDKPASFRRNGLHTHTEVTLAIKNQTDPTGPTWHYWDRLLPHDEADKVARSLIAEGAKPAIGTAHLRDSYPDSTRNNS